MEFLYTFAIIFLLVYGAVMLVKTVLAALLSSGAERSVARTNSTETEVGQRAAASGRDTADHQRRG